MQAAYLISAIGTPLTDSESLHNEGLEAHLADQWDHGINGILVAGTMGVMPLLRDETYRTLVRRCVEFPAGRGEILVGAGDCSLARTKERIEFLNGLKIDGVVVLPPYFIHFSQAELIDYYGALAKLSRAPLYLYDLPQRTRCKIELPTALELAKHPNIRGIKCSDEPAYARELMDAIGDRFRVVIAQPALLDVFLRAGMSEHLDGVFAIAPQWAVAIARHIARGEFDAAASHQRRLNDLRQLLVSYGVFQTMTVLLNARGIAGSFAPQPIRPLDGKRPSQLLAEPAAVELISGSVQSKGMHA